MSGLSRRNRLVSLRGLPRSGPYRDVVSGLSSTEQKQLQVIPHWDRLGFRKSRLPLHLRKRLDDFFDETAHKQKQESPQSVVPGKRCMLLSIEDHDPKLTRAIQEEVRRQLERWLGLSSLLHTATYGIRTYPRGATLLPHVDRYRTHGLSAIIHVRQSKMDEPWHLQVWDHAGQSHDIAFDGSDDMILYESSTCCHGRPAPLSGESFSNLFVHFKTPTWDNLVNGLEQMQGLETIQ